MDIFSKINQFANTAGGKASGAFELGKLSLKVAAEEKKINEAIVKIGEALVKNMDEGRAYDEPMMGFYADITDSRKVILALKAQIAHLNGNVLCASCQVENSAENNFCKACGVKLEDQPPIVAEVVEPENACPACGAPLEEDGCFCTSCGKRVDEGDPE